MLIIRNEDRLKTLSRYPDNYFDLLIDDPPFGGKHDACTKRGGKKMRAKRTQYHEFETVAPPSEYFDQVQRVSKEQIIFGVNHFSHANLPAAGRIVWDKKGTAFARAEIAYYSGSEAVNIVEYTWNGMLQQNMKRKESRIHPTQKPVGLYGELLKKYAKPGFKILDCHLGSGSSAIAAVKLGFDFVGCEVDPVYYEKFKKRIRTEFSQLDLYV